MESYFFSRSGLLICPNIFFMDLLEAEGETDRKRYRERQIHLETETDRQRQRKKNHSVKERYTNMVLNLLRHHHHDKYICIYVLVTVYS